MKKYLLYFLVLLFGLGIVYSAADEFADAKQIIDAKTPCNQLSEKQLEIVGDYLMEQIHPGQAHEAMDRMMGGEGSESLRLMHIAIAKRLYCNDINDAVNYGMMGGFGRTNYGGIMNWMWGNNFGYGMMGKLGYGYGYWGFWNLWGLLFWIGIIAFMIWLVYRFIIKRETMETPMGILRKRLASGKITKKQFEQMKKDIGE